VYWTLFIIYVVLTIVFAVDVVRNPALTVAGKVLWIAALFFVPVLAWLVYGIFRLRQQRGLA
jgi:Phospholipase_D-nuclease N-terminal